LGFPIPTPPAPPVNCKVPAEPAPPFVPDTEVEAPALFPDDPPVADAKEAKDDVLPAVPTVTA
jgi:hypothetical protein